MPRKSKQSGFSLMELMIVIAILSIGTIIAIPGFMSWRKDFWLKGASRDLLGHMQRAKLTAVKQRTDCTISFNIPVGGTTYDYIVYTDPENDRSYMADTGDGDQILIRTTWENDVDFDSGEGGGDGSTFTNNAGGYPTISFNSRGLPDNWGSVFVENTNGKQIKVVVSSAGNIKIEEY